MPEKKPLPQWLHYLLAGCMGAGIQSTYHTAATDSPIHFAVDGEAPATHEGWECGPEGGLVGAPMVCRPVSATDTRTQ